MSGGSQPLGPMGQAYSNSGLSRFAQPAPFSFPSYTPPTFQPQQLTPYRGGALTPPQPPQPIMDQGAGDGYQSDQFGEQQGGLQPGFAPDGMTAVTPSTGLTNTQANILGSIAGGLFGVPGAGQVASWGNSAINNQNTITSASRGAQMDTNPALNGTIGDVGGFDAGAGFGGFGGANESGLGIGPGGMESGLSDGFGGGLGFGGMDGSVGGFDGSSEGSGGGGGGK